ncbi:Do family serine endopeptidase [Rectinema subterraneum]|uniref:Do family serine endopeptidase n=1 Tax=Rectinema subterraneum TaxID=2653714 RepID=UPI00131B55A0|nr:Do family serine endopeptidase [Rectinema subterraneum]
MSFGKKLYSKNFFIANLVILGIVIGFALAFMFRANPSASSTALPIVKAETPPMVAGSDTEAAISQAEAVQEAFRNIAKTVLPAVVELDVVEGAQKNQPQQQTPQFPFDFFFGPDTPSPDQFPPQEGLGSGVIVRRSGKTVYVLTNHHVAGNATKITVKLSDGREYEGKLVGTDERKDVALVKFETDDSDIVIAKLGDSSKLQVGDWAIALGSPFGYVSSVTTGIISALGRRGGPDGNINDFIQTDAAINKGNSGGALVNIRGEVIGINTWIASTTGGSVGLGFAIPINNIKSAIDDFIVHGTVKYGWLGVSLSNITQDKASAKELGLDGKKGAFIGHVFMNGPADKAGLLPGDFVTAVDGKSVASTDDLVRMIGDIKAGTAAKLDIIRRGSQMTLSAKIELRDATVASNNANIFPGVTVISLKSDSVDQKQVPAGLRGALVVDVLAKSPAATMGLRTGDVITKINGKNVSDLKQFYETLAKEGRNKLVFTINRDGQTVETLAYVGK